MELVETDSSGNMIYAEHVHLDYHGTGNKAESEIKEKISPVSHRLIIIQGRNNFLFHISEPDICKKIFPIDISPISVILMAY